MQLGRVSVAGFFFLFLFLNRRNKSCCKVKRGAQIHQHTVGTRISEDFTSPVSDGMAGRNRWEPQTENNTAHSIPHLLLDPAGFLLDHKVLKRLEVSSCLYQFRPSPLLDSPDCRGQTFQMQSSLPLPDLQLSSLQFIVRWRQSQPRVAE